MVMFLISNALTIPILITTVIILIMIITLMILLVIVIMCFCLTILVILVEIVILTIAILVVLISMILILLILILLIIVLTNTSLMIMILIMMICSETIYFRDDIISVVIHWLIRIVSNHPFMLKVMKIMYFLVNMINIMQLCCKTLIHPGMWIMMSIIVQMIC